MYFDYDVIVVGGGHAGCEAATAAANLGCRTLLVTMDMTKFAAMSCNPAVGGVAKGQIVREIDALGGQMGIVTDLSTIQFRMLNRSKGAAMWSPRAQCDEELFSRTWRDVIERTDNLFVWQDTVVQLITQNKQSNRTAAGVVTRMGVRFTAKTVVLTVGTFLEGLMHVGRNHAEGGRAGDSASHGLSAELSSLGFEVGRMKTGTPARIDVRSLDLTRFERQEGDETPSKFSFLNRIAPVSEQKPCYLVYTSPKVHDTLRKGFGDSPLFQGIIKGIGPRYCPSIEDKLRTFADKDFHQLFLEPEGRDTNEYYLNGFSSSLPWDIQVEALQQIEGFENVQIYRTGYAIEYDYFPPTQLLHSLETKIVENLYFAGQINGTTGYEEAAAQGLMAGINAARRCGAKEPVVLSRDEAYIGVLIDDLVTKGVDEPYRMFTSRAEHRILLRQDNADLRLTPIAEKIGLATVERMENFKKRKASIDALFEYIKTTSVAPREISDYLESAKSTQISQSRKLFDLLIRNEISIYGLIENFQPLKEFVDTHHISREETEQVETEVKYSGYIEREKNTAEKLTRLENIKIPNNFNFNSIHSITIEARQKLSRIQPATIGQASRIPGVSPADINVLLVYFGR